MSSTGFLDWILDLLGLRNSAGNSAAFDPTNTVMEIHPDHGTVEQFIVTPCGYRIRVPQPADVGFSVGEMLPEVRESLAQIPPLPNVVVELLREVQNESSTSASVAKVAASDPVLTATLLRTVNSSAMGLKRKITSVTEAVSYLGLALVKSVLIRLRLDEMLPTTGATAAEAENLWIHSLAVSYVCEVLADRVVSVDRGFVSTLGLLHDIGKLAMLSQSDLHHQLATTAPIGDEDIRHREARVLGADHAGLGASLAHTWKLPSDLVQAIRFHHHPEKAFEATDPLPLRQSVYIVFIANQLVKLAFAHADNIEIAPIPVEASNVLGFACSLELLADTKVRQAISRAILFAAENTKQSKTAVKRLLRLNHGDAATKLVAASPKEAPARVMVNDTFIAELFDGETRRGLLAGSTREAEVLKLISAATNAQAKLDLPTTLAGPAAEMVHCLLPNLIDRAGDCAIELIQQFNDGIFTLGVRCETLRFARRLGPAASFEDGARLLGAEFAGLMNLGWIEDIRTSSDGGAVVLHLSADANASRTFARAA